MSSSEPAWKRRTRPCPFYSQGRCLFNESCNFLHDIKVKSPVEPTFATTTVSRAIHPRKPSFDPNWTAAAQPAPTVVVSSPPSDVSTQSSKSLSGILAALEPILEPSESGSESGMETEAEAEDAASSVGLAEGLTLVDEAAGHSYVKADSSAPDARSDDSEDAIEEESYPSYILDDDDDADDNAVHEQGEDQDQGPSVPIPDDARNVDSAPASRVLSEIPGPKEPSRASPAHYTYTRSDDPYDPTDPDDAASSASGLLSPVEMSVRLRPFSLRLSGCDQAAAAATAREDSLDSGYAESWTGPINPFARSPPTAPRPPSSLEVFLRRDDSPVGLRRRVSYDVRVHRRASSSLALTQAPHSAFSSSPSPPPSRPSPVAELAYASAASPLRHDSGHASSVEDDTESAESPVYTFPYQHQYEDQYRTQSPTQLSSPAASRRDSLLPSYASSSSLNTSLRCASAQPPEEDICASSYRTQPHVHAQTQSQEQEQLSHDIFDVLDRASNMGESREERGDVEEEGEGEVAEQEEMEGEMAFEGNYDDSFDITDIYAEDMRYADAPTYLVDEATAGRPVDDVYSSDNGARTVVPRSVMPRQQGPTSIPVQPLVTTNPNSEEAEQEACASTPAAADTVGKHESTDNIILHTPVFSRPVPTAHRDSSASTTSGPASNGSAPASPAASESSVESEVELDDDDDEDEVGFQTVTIATRCVLGAAPASARALVMPTSSASALGPASDSVGEDEDIMSVLSSPYPASSPAGEDDASRAIDPRSGFVTATVVATPVSVPAPASQCSPAPALATPAKSTSSEEDVSTVTFPSSVKVACEDEDVDVAYTAVPRVEPALVPRVPVSASASTPASARTPASPAASSEEDVSTVAFPSADDMETEDDDVDATVVPRSAIVSPPPASARTSTPALPARLSGEDMASALVFSSAAAADSGAVDDDVDPSASRSALTSPAPVPASESARTLALPATMAEGNVAAVAFPSADDMANEDGDVDASVVRSALASPASASVSASARSPALPATMAKEDTAAAAFLSADDVAAGGGGVQFAAGRSVAEPSAPSRAPAHGIPKEEQGASNPPAADVKSGDADARIAVPRPSLAPSVSVYIPAQGDVESGNGGVRAVEPRSMLVAEPVSPFASPRAPAEPASPAKEDIVDASISIRGPAENDVRAAVRRSVTTPSSLPPLPVFDEEDEVEALSSMYLTDDVASEGGDSEEAQWEASSTLELSPTPQRTAIPRLSPAFSRSRSVSEETADRTVTVFDAGESISDVSLSSYVAASAAEQLADDYELSPSPVAYLSTFLGEAESVSPVAPHAIIDDIEQTAYDYERSPSPVAYLANFLSEAESASASSTGSYAIVDDVEQVAGEYELSPSPVAYLATFMDEDEIASATSLDDVPGGGEQTVDGRVLSPSLVAYVVTPLDEVGILPYASPAVASVNIVQEIASRQLSLTPVTSSGASLDAVEALGYGSTVTAAIGTVQSARRVLPPSPSVSTITPLGEVGTLPYASPAAASVHTVRAADRELPSSPVTPSVVPLDVADAVADVSLANAAISIVQSASCTGPPSPVASVVTPLSEIEALPRASPVAALTDSVRTPTSRQLPLSPATSVVTPTGIAGILPATPVAVPVNAVPIAANRGLSPAPIGPSTSPNDVEGLSYGSPTNAPGTTQQGQGFESSSFFASAVTPPSLGEADTSPRRSPVFTCPNDQRREPNVELSPAPVSPTIPPSSATPIGDTEDLPYASIAIAAGISADVNQETENTIELPPAQLAESSVVTPTASAFARHRAASDLTVIGRPTPRSADSHASSMWAAELDDDFEETEAEYGALQSLYARLMDTNSMRSQNESSDVASSSTAQVEPDTPVVRGRSVVGSSSSVHPTPMASRRVSTASSLEAPSSTKVPLGFRRQRDPSSSVSSSRYPSPAPSPQPSEPPLSASSSSLSLRIHTDMESVIEHSPDPSNSSASDIASTPSSASSRHSKLIPLRLTMLSRQSSRSSASYTSPPIDTLSGHTRNSIISQRSSVSSSQSLLQNHLLSSARSSQIPLHNNTRPRAYASRSPSSAASSSSHAPSSANSPSSVSAHSTRSNAAPSASGQSWRLSHYRAGSRSFTPQDMFQRASSVSSRASRLSQLQYDAEGSAADTDGDFDNYNSDSDFSPHLSVHPTHARSISPTHAYTRPSSQASQAAHIQAPVAMAMSPAHAIATPNPSLMFAIASDDPEAVKRVLESGEAGPNDRLGPQSALAFALTNEKLANKAAIVKALLAYGANPASLSKADMNPPRSASVASANSDAEARSESGRESGVESEHGSARSTLGELPFSTTLEGMDPATRYFVRRASSAHTRHISQLVYRSVFRPLIRVRYDVIGQDCVFEQLFRVLSMHSQKLSVSPVVVMLCGPSGHGKSLLARKFGSLLDVPTHTVNMTTLQSTNDLWQSYSMSPYEEPSASTLAEFLMENEGKRCVVVLDEIEKTQHETCLWSLLMPWELGRCSLEAGKRHIDVRNVVWIGTSNIGHDLVFEHQDARADPEAPFSREEYVELMSPVRSRLLNAMGASLMSRVSATLPFVPFSLDERRAIAAEAVYALAGEDAVKEMTAQDVEDLVAKAIPSYIPSEGARSLYRAVSSQLLDSL